ncbi:hypothetical protein DID88_002579 [Monilinia fructigena]|uniref:Uncharacterized protein n=1 Tax=Monilinia fructigena TaxID=38457 RepID=A0A395IRS4_9HELO|nr:hypothetical protein DID88_002579 [Monilinia fructigena]
MRKHDKKWPVVDKNSTLADESGNSDGEEEEQDIRDSQIVDPSPTSLSAIASGSSVAVPTNSKIITAPAATISRTTYRCSVEAAATTQENDNTDRTISDNAEIVMKDSGKGGVKKEVGGRRGIVIDRRELTPAGFEAMSLTDGRDIRGSENYVAGDDKGAGTLDGEKNSGNNHGNNQSYEMWCDRNESIHLAVG